MKILVYFVEIKEKGLNNNNRFGILIPSLWHLFAVLVLCIASSEWCNVFFFFKKKT